MKTLFLVRHAKSSWDNPGLPDRDRPLADRGKRDVVKMGKRLAERDVKPDLILSSPAVRALATAEALAKSLDCNRKDIVVDARLYAAQADDLLDVIQELGNKPEKVMLVGHNPELDIVLDGGACVHLRGKGRKQRSVPLWNATVREIRAWLRVNPTMRDEAALLPNRDGNAMSRSNVAQRLELAVTRAATQVPGLLKKKVSPHTLRHTTAMHLLQSGVPFNVIALWLGHESTTTTHRYVEADLVMKEKALARLEAPDSVGSIPGARPAHAFLAGPITMRICTGRNNGRCYPSFDACA